MLLAAGCAAAPPPCGPAPPGLVVWVVDYGWHTEVVVPAAQVWPPLGLFRTLFPTASTLSFGFGKQSFMTLAHPGFTDLLAGTVPGPATVRVIPLPADPADLYASPVIRVPLTAAEWASLSAFLWRSFAHAPDGSLIPVAAEDPAGRFFAAAAGYSLAYTCNAWTIDALHQSGLPVGGFVVRSSGAMGKVGAITGACMTGRR